MISLWQTSSIEFEVDIDVFFEHIGQSLSYSVFKYQVEICVQV